MKNFDYTEDRELVEGVRAVLANLPPPSQTVLEAIHAEATVQAARRKTDATLRTGLYRRLVAVTGGLAAAAVLIFAVHHSVNPAAQEKTDLKAAEDTAIWNDALALVALDENDEITSGDDVFCEALLRFQERPGLFELAGDTYAVH